MDPAEEVGAVGLVRMVARAVAHFAGGLADIPAVDAEALRRAAVDVGIGAEAAIG